MSGILKTVLFSMISSQKMQSQKGIFQGKLKENQTMWLILSFPSSIDPSGNGIMIKNMGSGVKQPEFKHLPLKILAVWC